MRISRKGKALVIIGLVFSSLFGSYAGFFLYSINDYNNTALTLPSPDPTLFLSANSSRLYGMALWFEQNIANFHMPLNMIVNTWFNSTDGGSPTSYYVDYDSAEWTGHYLMAEAHRYAVYLREGNLSLCNETLITIHNLLDGIDKILHVAPNGGMARYAWPVTEFPGDPNHLENTNFYRGQWNGTDYFYEDDTSRDMYNGVIMGLGFVFLLVNDPEIRTLTQQLVETILDYFITHGWLYLDPNGNPNGTDLGPGFWVFGTSGIWTLAYLKVGALVDPTKYASKYLECAIDLDYIHRGQTPDSSKLNVISSYYGLLLEWETLFSLIMLETNPALRNIYISYAQRNIYDNTKNDRNAEFNMFWCAINNITRETPTNSLIIGDIEDCLSRYYNAPQRLPGRSINIDHSDLIDPTAAKWAAFYDNGIGKILYPFANSIFQFNNITKVALTPDQRPYSDYLWSYSPNIYQFLGQNSAMEGSGVDYLAVYWPSVYYNITAPSDSPNPFIEVHYPGA